jgi:capsular polysaccharide biosynthesis protein
MPTGMHRWRNRIFREGLLGNEALHNPKYLAAFLAMMFVGSVELTEGVLLGLPWNHNFYHWLVEMLPRLQLVEEVPALQQVPLLVPASAPAFVPESLRMAGYESRVMPLDDGVYRVNTLHIPTRLAATADVSPDALDWLDAKFPMSDPCGSRIYVSRGDSPIRYVSNELEIRTMLEQDHGFETLVMSSLSLDEQVRAFREASVIVGAHGAAFAHLAFAPRGAAFLELFQDGHFNHCYGHMAAIRGVRYGFLVGERDGLGLRVDRSSLDSMVTRMVRDVEPASRLLDSASRVN